MGRQVRSADLEVAAAVGVPGREHARDGGLKAYGSSFGDNSRRAAIDVAKILKEARPADLPVEQPTTFEVVTDRRTAKAVDLTDPPVVLARADEVIR